MRLTITTPAAIVVDDGEVVSVRAEDESGGFGVLDRHADFLTALTVSVISWRRSDGAEHFCAVRGGVFTVHGGRDVAVAARQAIAGENLEQLEQVVLARFRHDIEEEKSARSESLQLQMKAMRQIVRLLRPDEMREFGR